MFIRSSVVYKILYIYIFTELKYLNEFCETPCFMFIKQEFWVVKCDNCVFLDKFWFCYLINTIYI